MIHFQTILFYYFFHIFECSIDSNSLFLKIWKKKFADRAFLMVTWRPGPFSKKFSSWIFFIKIIPESSHFNQKIASNKSLHTRDIAPHTKTEIIIFKILKHLARESIEETETVIKNSVENLKEILKADGKIPDNDSQLTLL